MTTDAAYGGWSALGTCRVFQSCILRWYIVHAYSGMEKAVERNILERIDRAGMQDKFGRILGSHRRGGGDEERQQKTYRAPPVSGLCVCRNGHGRRHLALGEAHVAK